ncbi:helix-turn-helix domain-containing protein [Streptomyces sp. NPDC088194]|uniref:TetR/AcrR family transcriptional regulator n=1 Tax=Streptomyces sp. NPDC088194 TaxID=3154931 RepID=UPI00344E9C93
MNDDYGRLIRMTAGGPSDGTRRARPKGRDAHRPKDSAATRNDIQRAAARRFAERGFAHVTLQDIADDAGVTPALVNRYFVSKRALFELVAHSHVDEAQPLTDVAEFASDLMAYWQDIDRRTPALALVRSIDLDGGTLLKHELERRVREHWRQFLAGDPEAEAKIRLLESLTLGLGLFGIGALLGEDEGLSSETLTAMERRLALMIEACLSD